MQHMKVLVVEDEHGIANAIKTGLEEENYIVDLAYDGEVGYDLASDNDYDLIVLDLMLPKMDGLTVCKKIREEGIHTPILMLTARGGLKDKVTGLDLGADDYLVKPFAFEELLARLRALARRPESRQEDILSVKDLKINLKNFDVTCNGRRVKLSRKEFSLLEYLVRAGGQIVSKEQIINRVWAYDSDILENTVEVYIRNLRKKLGNCVEIETLRGFGYKLVK